MLSRVLARDSRRFGYAVALVAAVPGLVYLWPRLRTLSPGEGPRLALGVVAALAFAFPVVYPLRRKAMAWPLRNAMDWRRLHVGVGMVAFPCAVLHGAVRMPAGWLGWLLLGLGLWSTVFGVVAVMLQRRLPRRLAMEATEEIPAGRVDEMAHILLQQADRLSEGASTTYTGWYTSSLRPAFTRVHRSWRHLFDANHGAGFSPGSTAPATPDESVRVNALLTLAARKRSLDARASIQTALHYGVLIHVPAAVLLIALVAFHIFVVWYW
jgi:hypothetical protein